MVEKIRASALIFLGECADGIILFGWEKDWADEGGRTDAYGWKLEMASPESRNSPRPDLPDVFLSSGGLYAAFSPCLWDGYTP